MLKNQTISIINSGVYKIIKRSVRNITTDKHGNKLGSIKFQNATYRVVKIGNAFAWQLGKRLK